MKANVEIVSGSERQILEVNDVKYFYIPMNVKEQNHFRPRSNPLDLCWRIEILEEEET